MCPPNRVNSIENGWEDNEFISTRTAGETDLSQEGFWRQQMFGMTFDQYRDFILAEDEHKPENAEKITGVPAAKIRHAAEIMAKPKADGKRPKTSTMLEKGNYWAHNYENTASLASLGLLVGAGGRPGQVQSRAGGHQRGMISAASYPKDKSRDEYMGNKIELNVDKWVVEGNVRFMYVIGTTWLASMGAAQHLAQTVRRLANETGPQLTRAQAFNGGTLDVGNVIQNLRAKADAGGMVLVHQEIYSNVLTENVDVLLPAAGWGEEDFSRMQGERRLRIYSKIMDPPGEAKPDWWIVAQIAKRMELTASNGRTPTPFSRRRRSDREARSTTTLRWSSLRAPRENGATSCFGSWVPRGSNAPSVLKAESWLAPSTYIRKVSAPRAARLSSREGTGTVSSRSRMSYHRRANSSG